MYLDVDDDVPDVIARIRDALSDEVQLMVPSGARVARSRFNLLLLSQYAARLGKRVQIVTAEPAVQRMAREAGFDAVVDEYGLEAAPTEDWRRALAAVGGSASTDLERLNEPDRRLASRQGGERGGLLGALPGGVLSPPLLAASAARLGVRTPERMVVYAGAAVVLIAGIAVLLFLAPTATVILVAQATQTTAQVQVTGQPGDQGPIRTRTEEVTQKESGSFQATGTQVSSGQVAKGSVQFQNACPVDFSLKAGQQLATSSGVVFVQQNDIEVGQGATTSASVNAAQAGASGNVDKGQITTIQNNAYAVCLTVTNPEPITGGSDGQKTTVIQQSDMEQARTSLEKKLEGQIGQVLQSKVQRGEQLVPPVFQPPASEPDHQVNDTVKSFTMTVTVKGVGSYYNVDAMNTAFRDALSKRVPQGKSLTADQVKVANTQVIPTGGPGRLTFTGTATGYIAPNIDLVQVKRSLPGKPAGSARSQLEKQYPVRAVQIRQSPIPLPWLPFIGSRIDLKYRVEVGTAVAG